MKNCCCFMLAAGSGDGPVRKRRVWSYQQLIENPIRGEHNVLIKMEKMTHQLLPGQFS